MEGNPRDYMPAAGRDWLLPFYDPVDRLLRGGRDKTRLVRQAGIRPGERVLDVGCGTGALVLLVAREEPGAELTGIDPDPRALDLARRKAARAGIRARFDRGYCQELPYEAESFDVVLSSMMIHHLPTEAKRGLFREVARVLAPGGRFHALDFGPPRGLWSRLAARALRGHGSIAENLEGRLPALMEEAGLEEVRETGFAVRPIGALVYYAARAPGRTARAATAG